VCRSASIWVIYDYKERIFGVFVRFLLRHFINKIDTYTILVTLLIV
jgi:hypothetical protein